MQEAHQGVDHARHSGEALERIIGAVRQVASHVHEIAQATSSQKSSVESVRANIEAIDDLNRQALAAAEQGVDIASGLTSKSNDLDDAVKSFRIQ
jgi:methyl-accepting chemotaxis protein